MLYTEGPHERGCGGCLLLLTLFCGLVAVLGGLSYSHYWVAPLMLAFFVLGVGHWIWQVQRNARERNVQKERHLLSDPNAFNFTVFDLSLTVVFTTLFLVVEPYCGRLAVSVVMAAATAILMLCIHEEENKLVGFLLAFGVFLFIGMFPVIFGVEGTDLTGPKFMATLVVSIFLSMYLTLWVRSHWAKRAGGTPAEESRKQQKVQQEADATPPPNRRLSFWDTMDKGKKGGIGCLVLLAILFFFSESIQKLPHSEWVFWGLIIGWLLWWYWQKSGVFQLGTNIGHKGYDRLYVHIIVKVAQEEASLGAADELELLQSLMRERPDARWYEQTIRQYIRQAERSNTPLPVLLGKFRFRFDNDTCVHLLHAICRTLIRHRNNPKHVRRRLEEIAVRLGIPEKERRDVEERYGLARSYDAGVEVLILIAVKFALKNHVDFAAILDVVSGYAAGEWHLCNSGECRQLVQEARDYEYSLDELVHKFYSDCLHPFYPTDRTCISPRHIIGLLYKIMFGCGCHTRENIDYLLGLATKFDISPDELAEFEQKYKNFHYSRPEREQEKQEQTRQECGGASREQQQRQKQQEARREQKQREHRAFSAEELRFYEILGVAPGADFAEIKKAYHQRVMEYHPDKVNHLGKDLQELAERKMKAINEAFAYFEKRFK